MSNIVQCPRCDKTFLFGQPHECFVGVLESTVRRPTKIIIESNPGSSPDPRPPVKPTEKQ